MYQSCSRCKRAQGWREDLVPDQSHVIAKRGQPTGGSSLIPLRTINIINNLLITVLQYVYLT
jgi:hypothetical protein